MRRMLACAYHPVSAGQGIGESALFLNANAHACRGQAAALYCPPAHVYAVQHEGGDARQGGVEEGLFPMQHRGGQAVQAGRSG